MSNRSRDYFDKEEMKTLTLHNYRRALLYMRIEIYLTAMLIAMPIFNLFFHNIGMNRAEIGLSQAIFTGVMFFVDIPAGWVADRFSRKWANAFGDAIIALGLLIYSQASNMTHVIIFEIVLGVGMSFTNGADRPILRHYCEQIWGTEDEASSKALKNLDAVNTIWRSISEGAGIIVGGLIGAYGASWAIMASAIPYAIGAILSTRLIEPPRQAETKTGYELKTSFRISLGELKQVVSAHTLGKSDVTTLVYANALAANSTHAMIWLLTPLLLLVGTPVPLLGVSWTLNLALAAFGSYLAKKYASDLSDRNVFLLGVVPAASACAVMALQVSLWTLWLYLALGFARGWSAAALRPRLTLRAKAEHLATIESISSTVARVLYIPMVILIGRTSDSNIGLALAFNAIVIAVPGIFVALRLSPARAVKR